MSEWLSLITSVITYGCMLSFSSKYYLYPPFLDSIFERSPNSCPAVTQLIVSSQLPIILYINIMLVSENVPKRVRQKSSCGPLECSFRDLKLIRQQCCIPPWNQSDLGRFISIEMQLKCTCFGWCSTVVKPFRRTDDGQLGRWHVLRLLLSLKSFTADVSRKHWQHRQYNNAVVITGTSGAAGVVAFVDSANRFALSFSVCSDAGTSSIIPACLPHGQHCLIRWQVGQQISYGRTTAAAGRPGQVKLVPHWHWNGFRCLMWSSMLFDGGE